jgi:hypothetical protein
MSDLPSVNKKLHSFEVEIKFMKRGGSEDKQKPHKLFLLLAVLDLFYNGLLNENKIYFDEQLISGFDNIIDYMEKVMIGATLDLLFFSSGAHFSGSTR